MNLQPLSYRQDQKMRKFQAARFTEDAMEDMEHEVDTGNGVAYYWHYTAAGVRYTQRIDREKGEITITPDKKPL